MTMPDEIYWHTQFVPKDLHNRRVTELLQSNNELLERARRAEKQLAELCVSKNANIADDKQKDLRALDELVNKAWMYCDLNDCDLDPEYEETIRAALGG